MNCFFCQQPMESQNPSNSVYTCRPCSNQYKLGVGHLIIEDLDVNWAVILFHKNYQKVPNPKYETDKFFESEFIEKGIEYRIQLHIKDNFTSIEGRNLETNNKSLAIKVPGFPINPSNVDSKLHLYALFS